MNRFFAAVAHFATLSYFIAGFVLVNLLVLPVALFCRDKTARRRRVARMVTAGIAHFRRLLAGSRLVRFADDTPPLLRAARGRVIVANHPSLFDAPMLLASGSHITCFFKSSLRRSLLGIPAAQLAGYISNDSGVAGLLEAARRLREGENIIIFPESTRSAGDAPGPFHRAAATLAIRAKAPVLCLTFRYSLPVLSKRTGLFSPVSRLPLVITIRHVATLDPAGFDDAESLNAAMRRFICDDLSSTATPSEPPQSIPQNEPETAPAG